MDGDLRVMRWSTGMTDDEIINMAREAGYGWSMADMHFPALQRFAKLVAAREREECAKIVEVSSLPDVYSEPVLLEIANEIRARGEK